MAGHPSARELVAAVREFIAGLGLEGRDAFHAKVAVNALAIVERELEQGPDAAEVAAFAPLFDQTPSSPRKRGAISQVQEMGPRFRGDDGKSVGDVGESVSDDGVALGARRTVSTAADLRSAICTDLRSGTLTPATPGLLDALVAANLARLAVDNPRYSTFLRRSAAAPTQR